MKLLTCDLLTHIHSEFSHQGVWPLKDLMCGFRRPETFIQRKKNIEASGDRWSGSDAEMNKRVTNGDRNKKRPGQLAAGWTSGLIQEASDSFHSFRKEDEADQLCLCQTLTGKKANRNLITLRPSALGVKKSRLLGLIHVFVRQPKRNQDEAKTN